MRLHLLGYLVKTQISDPIPRKPDMVVWVVDIEICLPSPMILKQVVLELQLETYWALND